MPTYVYECKKCSDVFEVEQRITEDPLADCRCGGKGTLRRLIQPAGIIFNGPGFHVNDYASHGANIGRDNKSDQRSKSELPQAGSG